MKHILSEEVTNDIVSLHTDISFARWDEHPEKRRNLHAFLALCSATRLNVVEVIDADLQFMAFEHWKAETRLHDDFDLSFFDDCHDLQMSDEIVNFIEAV